MRETTYSFVRKHFADVLQRNLLNVKSSSKKVLALSVLLFLLLVGQQSMAQSTANYTFATNATSSLLLDINSNTVDMTTGTTSIVSASSDNTVSAVTNIGFPFYLDGNVYTQFAASADGLVSLGGSANASGTYITSGGSTATPRIAGLVADNYVSSSGKIHYKLIGTYPNRCLVIEFVNMATAYLTTASTFSSWQVRLYEGGTGAVEFVYGGMYAQNSSACGTCTFQTGFSVGASTNQLASVTTASNANSYATPFTSNTYTSSAVIPSLNSSTATTRRQYKWTPTNTPTVPTTLTFTNVGLSTTTVNWVDASTNEYNFSVYNSSDGGTTWNYVGNTVTASTAGTGAANSYAATGLTAGTTYQWRVYAVSEGKYSTALSGSQATTACGTYSGTMSVGPTSATFPNLTTAIANLTSCGYTGNIVLELQSGYTSGGETYPLTFNTALGSSSTKQITIRPQSGASGLSITSANTTATINLNGGKYITFDGRIGSTGTTSQLTIANTSAATSGTDIQFINDATNDTLRYVTLTALYNSTTSGVVNFLGGVSTGNDNNAIDNCTIDGGGVCANGIYSSGTSNAIDNSGISITNNNIINYFSAGTASAGIQIPGFGAAWTISNNKFYQAATRTSTAGSTHRAIYVITTSGGGFTINNNIIGYATNTQTGTTTYAGGFANRFIGIDFSATSATSNIQGNIISGISLTTTSGASTFPGVFCGIGTGMSNGATVANIGNTSANIIGATSGTGAILITSSTTGSLVIGIYSTSTGTSLIQNNIISSIAASGTAAIGCAFYGINTAGSSGIFTVSNNRIGSTTTDAIRVGTNGTTTTGVNNVIGILTANTGNSTIQTDTINNITSYNTTGVATMTGINVTAGATVLVGGASAANGNTISNLNNNSTAATSTLYGVNTSAGTITISNNLINSLSSAAANITFTSGGLGLCGIYLSSGTTPLISLNTINNLNLTNTGTGGYNMAGISYTAPTTSITITRNTIYGLANASTATSALAPGTASGIFIRDGNAVTTNINNNMIALGNSKTTNTSFIGIWAQYTSSSTTTLKIYHNSVNIEGTVSSGAQPSFGFYRGDFSTTAVTVYTMDVKNNIFVNTRSGGTGKHYAIANNYGVGTSSTTGWLATASNYNVLNGTAANIGYWSGDKTFATWQVAGSSSNDPFSYTGAAITFSNSASDLHINMGSTANVMESGGVSGLSGTGATDDIDAVNIRTGYPLAGQTNGGGTAPDIGADEFDGKPAKPVITLNTFYVTTTTTAGTTSQCTATGRDISVNVVPSAGTISTVTITYNNGAAVGPTAMTPVGSGNYTYTIPVASPTNTTVTWSITATNSLGFSTIYTGATYTDNPNFGITAVASARPTPVCSGGADTLSVVISKSGTVTLGAGASNSTTAPYDPFNGTYGGMKGQYLIKASELTALGLTAGNITALSFFIQTVGVTYNGFVVQIGNTALTAMPGTANIQGGLTTVKTAFNITPVAGANPITFDTPFAWDGSSNIIVSTSWSNNNASNTSATIIYDATPSFASSQSYREDNTTAANILTVTGTTSAATSYIFTSASSNRPKFTFTGNTGPAATNYSWSDGTSVVASGATANPAYVTTSANTTYTVTATVNGCPLVSNGAAVTVTALPTAPTLVGNSVQCGTGIPTASVSGAATLRWYHSLTGTTILQTGGTTYGTSISATDTFYVASFNGTCESGRTRVIATVNAPDALTAAASTTTIGCLGNSTNLSVSQTGSTNTYTLTWTATPSAGSGITTSASGTIGTPLPITPTAAGSYKYTITGVDGSCTTFDTIRITVNNPNVGITATATARPTTVCSGGADTLSVVISKSGTVTLGAGASNSTTAPYDPFNGTYGGMKGQYLIKASELTALGLTAGNITALSFFIQTVGVTYNGFVVQIGNTALTAMPGTANIQGGLTTVKTAFNITPVAGANPITFDTPFAWDGSSNIIVSTSWSNNNASNTSATIIYDATPSFASSQSYREDNTTAANILTVTGTTSAATSYTFTSASSNRPKFTFTGNTGPAATNYSWSDGTSVVASGATANPAYITTSANTTYTVTATVNSCPLVSNGAAVTVTALPTAPTLVGNSVQCGTGIPTASVSGAATLRWYHSLTGTTILQTGGTTYGTSISATDTFYVASYNGTCESGRTRVIATVNAPDAITAYGGGSGTSGGSTTTPATFCLGSTEHLYVIQTGSTNTYTYTWSCPTAGNGITTSTGTNIDVTPSSAGTFVYTVTANDATLGCTTTSTFTLTVTANPSVTVNNPAICNGLTATLTAGGATSYVWTGGLTLSGSGNNTGLTLPLIITTTYTVTGTTAGCTGTATAVVTVVTPTIQSVTPGSRCGTGTVGLSATPSSGATIRWFSGLTGANWVGSGNSFTTPSISATTPYYAEAYAAAPGTATVGTNGTTLGSASVGGDSPFGQYYEAQHSQYLYTATDLNNAGLVAGNLTALSFYVTTKNSTKPFTSYTIKLATTNATTMTGILSPTFTTVYAASSTINTGYSTNVNANNFIFGTGSGTSSSFNWDGTSNILVDICFANDPTSSGVNNYSSTDIVRATTKSTYTPTYSIWADNTTYCGITTGTNSSSNAKLPDIVFSGQIPNCVSNPRTSDTAKITTPVAVIVTPSTVTICNGSTASFTASSAASYSYSWTGGLPAGASQTTPTLAANTTYTVTGDDGAGCTASASATVTVVPSSFTATAGSASFCGSGSTTISLSPSTGLGTATIQWQISDNNSTWRDSTGATATTLSTGTLTATRYYRAAVKIGASTCVTSSVATVSVNNPAITGTTPGSRCGPGTVGLAAAGVTGSTVSFYATKTSTTPLFTGTVGAATASYTTSSISTTTKYYVASSFGGSSETGGRTTQTATSGFLTSPDWGVLFNATANLTLVSTTIYPVGTGTVTIALQNSSGTQLAVTSAVPITGATGSPLVVNLGFNVPAGTAYRLVLKSYTGITDLYRESAIGGFPYTSSGGLISVTNGWTATATSTSYYWFYSLVASSSCEGTRDSVTATINTAPAIIASGNNAICSSSSSTLSVSSSNAGYSYVWTPGSLSGTPKTVTPGSTTKYVVTATDASGGTYNGCSTKDSVVVTVLPTSVTATAANTSICGSGGTVVSLSPSTGYGLGNIVWESSPDNATWSPQSSNSSSLITGSLLSNTYFHALVNDTSGTTCSTSNSVFVTVNNPLVVTTKDSTKCTSGTFGLSATGSSGTTLKWYAALNGGTALTTDTSYTTPSLSSTTTYYVEAVSGTTTSGSAGIGNGGTTGTGAAYNPTNGGYGGIKAQYLFTAAELSAAGLSAGNITNLSLEYSAVGASLSGFNIQIGTTSLTTFASNIQGGLSTVYTISPYVPTTGVNNFLLSTPFNWDGTSNIIVSISWSNNNTSNTSSTVLYDATSNYSSQSYRKDNETSANMLSFTGTTGAGTSTFDQSQNRPKITFSGQVSCASSPRTPVYAIVSTPTVAPTVPSTMSICSDSIVTLTASGSTNSNVTSIFNENFNGSITGWTKSNTGSNAGTPSLSNWKQQAAGYYYYYQDPTYGDDYYWNFYSNDTSSFMLSNSDAQVGSTTNQTTSLFASPAFSTAGYASASLTFYQNFVHGSNDSAVVQISTDNGTTWANIAKYTSTQGRDTLTYSYYDSYYDYYEFDFDENMAPVTIDISSYVNSANVKLRFKYTHTYDAWWAVDNISITGVKAVKYAWTPKTGLYTNPLATSTYAYDSLTTPNAPTVYAKPTDTIVYKAIAYVDQPSSCSGTNTVTVNVSKKPTASLDPVKSYLCDNTAILSASSVTPPSSTLTWSNVSGSGTLSSASSNPTTVTGLAAGTSIYQLKASNGVCSNIPIGKDTIVMSTTTSSSIATSPSAGVSVCNYCVYSDGNTKTYYNSTDGKIIAAITDATTNSASLGETEICFKVDGSVQTVTDNLGNIQPYLQRVWTIHPTAGSDANITLYFTAAELAALQAAANSGVYQFSGLGNLGITKYSNGGTNATPNYTPAASAGGVVVPSSFSSYGSDYKVQFNVSSFSTFYVHPQLFPFGALPVELTSFTGWNAGTENQLQWKTASELNTLKYIVEKSTDGRTFSYLGELPAAGNSNQLRTYNLTDVNPVVGNNYYRLRILDTDGKFSYSNVINIPISEVVTNSFTRVYPNPTGGKLNVELQSTAVYETSIIVYDVIGTKMYEKTASLVKGTNLLEFDFTSFAKGAYILHFTDNSGKTHTTKFVKD